MQGYRILRELDTFVFDVESIVVSSNEVDFDTWLNLLCLIGTDGHAMQAIHGRASIRDYPELYIVASRSRAVSADLRFSWIRAFDLRGLVLLPGAGNGGARIDLQGYSFDPSLC